MRYLNASSWSLGRSGAATTGEGVPQVRTGVCLVRPSELAPEWHAAISGKTRAFVQGEEGSVPSTTWPQSAVAKNVKELVGDDVDTVLRSASVRGALQSILGKDFALEPGMAMHLTNGIDQTWVSAAALWRLLSASEEAGCTA